MTADILNFLIPGNDPIQITFFSIISTSVITTILWVTIKARKQFWEQNWRGGKIGHDGSTLEVEHGSIHELSQAVATMSEKIAGIMPGMLLVLGLLGTFLGLGLALDHASTILQKSGNASVGGMGSAMQDLTAMMQGLGTKFKTSTWGIIAFILLKIWDALNGFDDRRLTWCIEKMKTELEKSRQQREQASQAHEKLLQSSIANASNMIVSALTEQTEAMNTEWRTQAEYRQQNDQKNQIFWQARFSEIKTEASTIVKSMDALLETQREAQSISLQSQTTLTEIANSAQNTQIALSEFTSSSRDNLEALQRAGQTMGDAASKVSESADDLKCVVSTLSTQIAEVMNGVKTDLGTTLDSMNEDFSKNLKKMGEQLEAANNNLAKAMNMVKTDLESTINTMNTGFSQNLNKMGEQLEMATENLTNVMNMVKTDLGSTISGMSKDFSLNLVSMSTNLGKATHEISRSIDSMSTTVNNAMENVAGNMEATAEAQKKTTREFEMVSENLNGNILAIQGIVDKLAKDIISGLKAVSESGQRMVSLDKRYDKVSEMLIKIPESLNSLAIMNARPQVDLEPLQRSLEQISEITQRINDSVKARRTAEA